ncbi:MAG: hypothetical protein JSW42_15385 [Chloroflexota bacterium]|nr:MAG: hypothetical protein JSW42_15385 [Chloroflexota bacterium]
MNNNDLTQKFSDLQPQFVEIAADLHRLILSIFPITTPTFDGENVSYGFGGGYKDLAFVVTPHTKFVNLGIINVAAHEDPTN